MGGLACGTGVFTGIITGSTGYFTALDVMGLTGGKGYFDTFTGGTGYFGEVMLNGVTGDTGYFTTFTGGIGYFGEVMLNGVTGGTGYFTTFTGGTGYFGEVMLNGVTGGTGYFTMLTGGTGNFTVVNTTGTYSYAYTGTNMFLKALTIQGTITASTGYVSQMLVNGVTGDTGYFTTFTGGTGYFGQVMLNTFPVAISNVILQATNYLVTGNETAVGMEYDGLNANYVFLPYAPTFGRGWFCPITSMNTAGTYVVPATGVGLILFNGGSGAIAGYPYVAIGFAVFMTWCGYNGYASYYAYRFASSAS